MSPGPGKDGQTAGAQLWNQNTGIDGVNKTMYEVEAVASVHNLVQRTKRFQYWLLPVRRTYTPKSMASRVLWHASL